MKLQLLKDLERHPLCVDLDGTLVKTDTLIEAIFVLLRDNPYYLFLIPLWLFKGRLGFKNEVFRHAKLDVSSLPYNKDVLDIITTEKDKGRIIVLVTASPHAVAEPVASYLGLFSQVLATDEKTNLKGSAKAKLLCDKFGEKGFDYMGDSKVDLKVWEKAERSFLVNTSKGVEKKARRIANVVKSIPNQSSLVKLLMKQVRVHQWAKNILIFLPLFLSYRIDELALWLSCLHAFASFSMLSSSVYVLNDLLDLDADRRHPDNKKRPFASGDLPLSWGGILFPLLLTAGIISSATLSGEFFQLILGYFILTSLYSFKLKKVVLADILILASLYSWRVVAGAVACGIILSHWFISFSIFFFLSLALVKRSSELILMEKENMKKNSRRGYVVSDLPLLLAFGVSSGYLSILVLALYISTPEVQSSNASPEILWACLPFLLYWLSRIWLKAYRGEMPSDPLVFAMKDKLSYTLIFLIGVMWVIAKTQ